MHTHHIIAHIDSKTGPQTLYTAMTRQYNTVVNVISQPIIAHNSYTVYDDNWRLRHCCRRGYSPCYRQHRLRCYTWRRTV